jgi:mitofusin
VSERLSSPNIFIVHNRSDAFAGEENQNEVKGQHLERAISFLVDELGVCSNKSEAEDRIFFISAKEALQTRVQEAKGLPPQISTEDYFPRYLEFQNFERKFAACLSNSAVRTKFAQHTHRGKVVVQSVAEIMANVNAEAQRQQKSLSLQKKELWDRCDFTEKQLELMTMEMKEKIHLITEDVEYKVGKAMSEEIRRLGVLVDEFNDPFHPDPLVLNVYKSKLNHHIESGVGSNLKTRLSTDLQLNMESHQQEMIERMTALLPVERQSMSRNIMPRRETFEVLYHLHCENLCSDFQEDLRFRFSMGMASMIQRFLGGGRQNAKRNHSPPESVPRGVQSSHSPVTPTNEFFVPQDEWSLVSKIAVASLTSQGTMGGLLVGGLLLKTVGWRVIIVTGAIYGSLYAYERLTWTTQARCREFKYQYVDHAARKLRLIVDMTSANCSHQVQQELSSTFARLCHLVDETTGEMKDDIKRIDAELSGLEENASRSKVLKNKANFIANKLELFDQTYLADTTGSDSQ